MGIGYLFGMAYQTLKISVDPAPYGSSQVLTVTLNRPEVRNAFNDVLVGELTSVFKKEAQDPKVRAIVLKGEGKVFCAGGDLNWLKGAIDYSYEQNLEDTRQLARMFALMNEINKPLIGLIQGAAIGGGVGLVSVCDIVVASSEAVFSLSEVRLGVVPACIGPFVVSKIGMSHARGLFMSAERFSAEKAKEVALVHEVVDSPEKLDEKCAGILKNISQCGPNAMGIAKELVFDLAWPERRNSLEDPIDHVAGVLSKLRTTEEAQEGMRAFLEKRKPAWMS